MAQANIFKYIWKLNNKLYYFIYFFREIFWWWNRIYLNKLELALTKYTVMKFECVQSRRYLRIKIQISFVKIWFKRQSEFFSRWQDTTRFIKAFFHSTQKRIWKFLSYTSYNKRRKIHSYANRIFVISGSLNFSLKEMLPLNNLFNPI